MSKKPKKISEERNEKLRLEEKMKKKVKKTNHKIPPYIFIVSEGTKTEVAYMKGFVEQINKKYKDFSSDDRVKIHGTGRSCKSLLEYTRRIVGEKMPQAEVVWLMYDKDDFPLDDFDNTEYSVNNRKQRRKYKVAWSNECLELWFVLHFQELTANVGRERYSHLLEKHCNYEKNDPDLFFKMQPYMDIAIKRAKKQYEEYGSSNSPSNKCPATRVFELVEELREYL